MRTLQRREDGWYVYETSDLSLDGPYETKAEARKRMAKIDHYIHMRGGLSAAKGPAPEPEDKKSPSRKKTTRKKSKPEN